MSDKLPANDPRLERILYSHDVLLSRIRELAAEIVMDFAGHDTVYMVGVIKGACVFMADLGREIRRADGPRI